MAKYRDYCEAPRWARVPAFIKNTAFMLGLDVSMDIDAGLIRETVRFEVSGDQEKVSEFIKAFLASVKEYQSRASK